MLLYAALNSGLLISELDVKMVSGSVTVPNRHSCTNGPKIAAGNGAMIFAIIVVPFLLRNVAIRCVSCRMMWSGLELCVTLDNVPSSYW